MSILHRLRGALNLVTPAVSFDESGITRTMKNGRVETIRWEHLEKVEVQTTSGGPWSEDVFILLTGSVGGCAVPQGAAGSDKLVERLTKLPGFNSERFIEAMSSTSNAEFVCWEKGHAL